MSSGDGASSNGHRSYVNEVVVVGAGFAGMYMLHKLRGLGFDTVVLERADDVGGTWYWNRYPGARCDIESMQYSYSFDPELEQEWEWTERYSSQPEILRYANHVADRYDLRRDIRFETTVERVDWDDKARHWRLRTDRGEYRTRFVVMATGCLSTANTPQFDGIDSFEGDTHHTGRWPHEGVGLRRQVGCSDRHGLVRSAGDPGDRTGVRGADGVPANAELLHPSSQRAA